jgi:hypothetical protein
MSVGTTTVPYLGADFFAVGFVAGPFFTPEPFFRGAGEEPKCPR